MPLTVIFVQTTLTLAAVIVLTRLNGLRSFSKMSGFEFAITVAIGSVLASAATSPDQSVLIPLGGLVALYVLQGTLARLRRRWPAMRRGLDNRPLLVMEGATILDANLARAGMTRSDLFAKLREANAYRFDRVKAVVVEGTGDVSVLHGPADGEDVEPCLLDGVRR